MSGHIARFLLDNRWKFICPDDGKLMTTLGTKTGMWGHKATKNEWHAMCPAVTGGEHHNDCTNGEESK
jgi:hypothetical protein